jgi:hypothetical protein
MVSAKKRKAAKKAWRTRKKRYGKDGLSPKGERKIAAAAKKRKGKRRKSKKR